MRKGIALLLLLIINVFPAQLSDFLSQQYIDCLEDNYQLDLGISLSQINEGSYQKAIELLETDYYKSHPKEKFLIQNLLDYNTKGKKYTYQTIEESNLSSEEKDFTKLWLSYYTNNNNDYEVMLKDFKKKYPSNLELLKLEIKKELNERKFLSDLTQYSKEIDSVLTLPDLSTQNKLHFTLTKLDVSELDEDYEKNKLKKYLNFIEFWKEHKEKINYNYASKVQLDDCKTKDCETFNDWILEQKEKNSPTNPSNKIFSLLLQQVNSDSGLPIPTLQKKIDLLLSQETEITEIQNIKALVNVYFLTKEPDFGFWFKGMLKPIPFDANFRKKYLVTLNKQECIENIKTIAQEFAKEKNKTIDLQTLQEMQKEATKYPVEDVKVMYGILVFLKHYARSLEKALATDLGYYKDSPQDEIYTDSKLMLNYLEKNPLFYDDNLITASDAKFKDIVKKQDLDTFSQNMLKLTDKYPYAYGIQLKYLTTLSQYENLVYKEELQNYYLDYLKKTIDLLSINQKLDFNNLETLLFINFKNLEGSGLINYYKVSEDFFKKIDVENKKIAMKYLLQKINENPYHNNLKEMAIRLSETIDGLAYLDLYFNYLESEESTGSIDINFDALEEVNKTEIKTVLKNKISEYISKNKSFELYRCLPLAFYVEDNNLAIDIVKNFEKLSPKDNYQFVARLSDSYHRLYNQSEDDEAAIKNFTEIFEYNPTSEISFVFLTLIKMEEDIEKGKKFFEKYNRYSLDKVNLDAIREVLYLAGFDEENKNFILQELEKKHRK